MVVVASWFWLVVLVIRASRERDSTSIPRWRRPSAHWSFCSARTAPRLPSHPGNPLGLPVEEAQAVTGDNGGSRYFYDNIIQREVDFDIIGLSFYPLWHGLDTVGAQHKSPQPPGARR